MKEAPHTLKLSPKGQTININFKRGFETLGKAGLELIDLKWVSFGKELLELIQVFQRKNPHAHERAYVLVLAAATKACIRICKPHWNGEYSTITVAENWNVLGNDLDQTLIDGNFELDEKLFRAPGEVSCVAAFVRTFYTWLKKCGMPDEAARRLSQTLPDAFARSIEEIWVEDQHFFTPTGTHFDANRFL